MKSTDKKRIEQIIRVRMLPVKTWIVVGCLPLLLFSGCGDRDMEVIGDATFPGKTRLHRIWRSESITAEGQFIWSEYEYDARGRISKVSYPMGNIAGLIAYDLYSYDTEGRLEKIMNYHPNISEGFLNLENTLFRYDAEGNKVKMQKEHPIVGESDSTLYFYNDSRLVKEINYHRDVAESEKEYEYNDREELVREMDRDPGDENKIFRITLHSYQDGLQVKSEVFLSSNTKIREIDRYYDRNGNLIRLESKELSMYSSSSDYVLKYEYRKD